MRKAKVVRIGLGALLLACLGPCLGYWWVMDLSPAVHREPAVEMEELLVPVAAFPAGWTAETQMEMEWPLANRETCGTVGREFYSPGLGRGYASQDVLRLRNELQARVARRFLLQEYYAPASLPPGVAWVSPAPAWDYDSPIADEFEFICVEEPGIGVTECHVYARYDEFLCSFTATMSPVFANGLSEEDLGNIFAEMDERFGEALGKTEN